jgi:hypothetical protein
LYSLSYWIAASAAAVGLILFLAGGKLRALA